MKRRRSRFPFPKLEPMVGGVVELPRRKVSDATQLLLFEQPTVSPSAAPKLASPQPLTPDDDLGMARFWYKNYLRSHEHPENTVTAYTNDLQILYSQVGKKPLKHINSTDIKAYLDSANRKSTRKRRLTSVREFYGFLIRDRKILQSDPTESFFPERINLKVPIPLFEAEQTRLLEVAAEDGPRSYLMVYLMLRLGFNRTEVLSFQRQHVDLTFVDAPVVYVQYDDPRWRHKVRHLRADRSFADAFRLYTDDFPGDRLFPFEKPQAVNAIIHRLAKAAEISKLVTPQSLRDTFGVEQAKAGKTEDELLAILGLAADPRNRDSVRRYIRLAEPAQEVSHAGDQNSS